MAAAAPTGGLSSFRLLGSGSAQVHLRPPAAACRRRLLLRCAASGGGGDGSSDQATIEEQKRRRAELSARIASGEFTVQGSGLALPLRILNFTRLNVKIVRTTVLISPLSLWGP